MTDIFVSQAEQERIALAADAAKVTPQDQVHALLEYFAANPTAKAIFDIDFGTDSEDWDGEIGSEDVANLRRATNGYISHLERILEILS